MILLSGMVMNIGGSEWAIIIILGLILVFGPKKLPQLSRAFGKASGEYEKARELFRIEQENMKKHAHQTTYHMGPKILGPVTSQREKLEEIAKSLGIDYVGKTDDELRFQITEKIHRY
jgi:sec-independent protein translocase protein TatA